MAREAREYGAGVGRPYRGRLAHEWEADSDRYARLAAMTDAELEQHFADAGTLAAARLAELRGGAR